MYMYGKFHVLMGVCNNNASAKIELLDLGFVSVSHSILDTILVMADNCNTYF